MHHSYIGALLLGACGVHAFQDTSPFLYASTSKFPLSLPQISRPSTLLSSIASQLFSSEEDTACSTTNFLIVNQPGVAAADLHSTGSAPTLQSLLNKKVIRNLKTSLAVPEVIGGISGNSLKDLVVARCGGVLTKVDSEEQVTNAASNERNILMVDLPALSGPNRVEQLRENDRILLGYLKNWKGADLTLFYTSSPPSAGDLRNVGQSIEYEMDESLSPLHLDLKRDHSIYSRADDTTLPDGPLFEKYQYFTPGIFMGLITFFFLFAVGTVGIRALSSLQVSYAAFDKENGPQAQKKAQ